jgi:putative two-component system response regulator
MPAHASDTLDGWLSRARVLIVDDEPANLTFLRHVLETEGYGELIATTDAADACVRFRELDPDVIVTDLRMPRLHGFELIERVQLQLPPGTYLPILVVTADTAPESRRRALSLGARDFLTKPLSPSEVRLRVRNLLETRFLHEQLKQHNLLLEHRVDERTLQLEEARLEVLYRLARAAEFRDDQTGQHTLRVGRLSGRLAQVLGLGAEQAQRIERAAPLHDIGKIGVPDSVLLKRGRLDADERTVIETHTVIGADILSGSGFPLLRLAEEIALSHHERWDGLGYPHGLAGASIPISGRIVAVADVFDALTHERPYKPAWTVRQALVEIEASAGTQLDPGVVEALFRVAPEAQVIDAAADADAAARRLLSPLPVTTAAASRRVAATAPTTGAATDGPVPATGAATGEPVPATVVQRLQLERDALAREVEQLRRQLARREIRSRTQRSGRRRTIQPA